jgi:GNAT superfamily N-acetyltransferase
MNLKIRKAVLEDQNQLFLLVQNFAASFKPEKNKFNEILKSFLADENVFLYVAESENQLAGYCLGFDHYGFFANGRVSWLEEIMVVEKFRRGKIGTKLMDKFENWSVKRDSRLVALATRRASLFYKALNYEESAVYFRKLL